DAENHSAFLQLPPLGALFGSGGAAPDVTVPRLQILAGSGGIGTAGVPLRIDVAALATSSAFGSDADQFLAATGTVGIGGGGFPSPGLNAAHACITLTSGTFQAQGPNAVFSALRVQGATFDIGTFTEIAPSFSFVGGALAVE